MHANVHMFVHICMYYVSFVLFNVTRGSMKSQFVVSITRTKK